MHGRILILEYPNGSLEDLVSRLEAEQFIVSRHDSPEGLLNAIETESAQLLIATGESPDLSGTQLVGKVGALSIPIFLVLSTAGEETQTFLRRHPSVIGVYYRPINIDKMLERIHRLFST